MTELSPEDISRAREWRETKYELTSTVWTDELVAAYSAAENERLTQELEQERAKTDVELEDRAEAAEAKCDRLKGALLRLAKLVEDGVLVRNTNDDATLGSFVEQAVRLTRVLKETQEALA